MVRIGRLEICQRPICQRPQDLTTSKVMEKVSPQDLRDYIVQACLTTSKLNLNADRSATLSGLTGFNYDAVGLNRIKR